ncbi:hypothetical protein PILCRDRAFT_823112 [Piloderma croceum F 1598]|uniref:Uncharacterized protein n=1 Tax=Piloderma croceum (strain F 1598) TaxID=765440 RepID=A0A0C3F4B2_PILCF|nr:hypothetical protein PILCRDRAFT_823112 [Piloderma croceum F 1598]
MDTDKSMVCMYVHNRVPQYIMTPRDILIRTTLHFRHIIYVPLLACLNYLCFVL